ncbi:MAG: extracellular solute-binding protein [Hyphomicrobiales bacterium]|nr:extracellular solute-binding protein [Hyphomicrobiales bacterium]
MKILISLLCALTLAATGAVAQDRFIILQSTTSTANSGLLDHLAPKFRDKTGIEIRVVAVGTGQALKNARNGDGDVLLVHAKQREEKFVADGFGTKRYDVMYNDFIIVGPDNDPADIAGHYEINVALKKIAAAKAPFASRGDESGTHIKELSLWKQAGVDAAADSGSWYRETGSGMGATLNIATGMNAYTLTDRATWVAFANKSSFRIMVQGDKRLFNQYGIILVNQEKHPHVKAAEGQAFIDWLISPEGQMAISAYRRDDQQMFFPNAN